jgi:hypothetical protein
MRFRPKELATHAVALVVGFAAGIYMLPIITAPASPDAASLSAIANSAQFSADVRPDLDGSDFLHRGEGTLYVGENVIAFEGKITPGPDYRLYLSPEFVENEAGFTAVRARMVEVGPVRSFENFVVPVPSSIDAARYRAAIVWCESFGEFITAAKYQ